MKRSTAKFIAENATSIANIIDGVSGTYVVIDAIAIYSSHIRHMINNIDVIQAYGDGAEIQYCDCDCQWEGIEFPSFIDCYSYRIKPQPREYCLGFYKRSGLIHYVYTKDKPFKKNEDEFEYINVIEVL